MIKPMALCAMTLLQSSLVMAEDFFISTQADFDRYRQATFSPGDQILFERRQTFEGMFAPNVVGTSAQPIRISTFGRGVSPRIHNNGVIHPHPTRSGATVSAGIFLLNPEYVTVSNLEITNNNGGDQDDENLFGILVVSEDTGKRHQQIIIDNNYVHSVNGAVAEKGRGGIHVIGISPTGSQSSSYNDLRIINNRVENIGGVGIATDIPDVVRAQDFTGSGIRPNAITNLYVARNTVKNTGRNGFIIRDSEDALIEYNIAGNSGLYSKGHSFFNFNTIGAVFQYNEAYGNTGPADESDRGGFDADYNAIDTTFQYNYSHSNNYFAGIMKRPNDNVTFRYNISVNELFGAYFFGFENDTDLTDLKIYNNTHYLDATIDSPVLIVRDRTPHETTFNNNIFYSEDSGIPGADTDDGVNVTFNTNAYFQWTPPNSERNALTSNPQLLSPGAEPYDVDMEFGRHVLNGYRLATNSPYGSRGVSVSNNGGRDFWGVPLSGNSVGASQFSNQQLSPGATVFTNRSMPNSLAVAAATTSATSDDAKVSLSQTFQVDETFDLGTIYLGYEYDGNSDPSHSLVNVEIFEVADVAASRLIQGTSILTLSGVTVPQQNTGLATIVLDSSVTLEETSGSNGYALRITNGRSPGFEWDRTGSSSASVYSDGQAYEDGNEKSGGERDFVLGLESTDREPSNQRIVHIRKRNALDFAIDGNNGAADGQSVYLWSQNSSNVNQQWIEIDHDNDYYSYQKQGTEHCIYGGLGGSNRQNVTLLACDDSDQNQQWEKVSTDSGFFKLVKRNAPFAIDAGNGGSKRQNVKIFDASSSSENIQWRIDGIN